MDAWSSHVEVLDRVGSIKLADGHLLKEYGRSFCLVGRGGVERVEAVFDSVEFELMREMMAESVREYIRARVRTIEGCEGYDSKKRARARRGAVHAMGCFSAPPAEQTMPRVSLNLQWTYMR